MGSNAALLEASLRENRTEILRIAQKHGARNIRVFGSAARGEMRPESDIDFLIDYGPETSPWFPAGLVVELEALLGRPVQVVTEKSLHALLRERILNEAMPV
jgi:hypothetical protein